MGIREKAVVAVIAVIALYAGAACYWYMSQEKAWKKARRDYEKSVKTYVEQAELISERNRWNNRYEEEKSKIAMFDHGKATDTTWLRKMDEIAAKHHIFISNRQAGKVVEGDEVQELEEMEIEVKSWEGSLESLVRFMHELQTTTEGMFDIKSLNFKPSSKKGYLKGNFVLSCAYMRGQQSSAGVE